MTVLDRHDGAGLMAGICLVIVGVAITSLDPATRHDAQEPSPPPGTAKAG